jgi:nitrogen fixation protein FixH
MTDVPSPTARFTGWHMWAILIAFFGVVIGVNVLLAVVSAQSWTGMVVEDPYIAGQGFETQRKAHEAQITAGWVADFSYANGVARLTVMDGNGKPVDLGAVTVEVTRPVGGHEDQTPVLTRRADGSYEAPLVLPNGAWDATITAESTPLGPFELIRRFAVRDAK